MEIEFPQELLLVNHIPALHRRVIGVDLLDLSLLFLFGHSWGGSEARGGGGGRSGTELYEPRDVRRGRENIHRQHKASNCGGYSNGHLLWNTQMVANLFSGKKNRSFVWNKRYSGVCTVRHQYIIYQSPSISTLEQSDRPAPRAAGGDGGGARHR